MEKYIKLINEGNLEGLTNSLFFYDLVNKKYQGKYLIEFLLEKGIHTDEMDNYVKYNFLFAKFYFQYNILKPLIKCSLLVLLKQYDDGLLLDQLLNKLGYDDKMELYHNIKIAGYNEFRLKEKVIRDSYLKHGIVLPKIFIDVSVNNMEYEYQENDILINELMEVYSDHEKNLMEFVINELRKGLMANHNRGISDIRKLIDYKRNNPQFKISFSLDANGQFIKREKKLEISSISPIVFSHEFSHLLFQEFEDDEVILEYEKIREKIDNEEMIDRMMKYLKIFHQKYRSKKQEYEQEYYDIVNTKYGSFEHYIEIICKDILDNKKDFSLVSVGDKIYDLEICDIKFFVLELLEIEKNEYISNRVRNFYGKELMLENLLDALVMGKLCDDMKEECLSGHSVIYYLENDTYSFDESLADFDAIKKYGGEELIEDLRKIIGDEMVLFLEKYLEKNRENGYGNR